MDRIFLLDASGSMFSRLEDAIGSFNSFVASQSGGTMTLYTFNDDCTCIYKNKSLDTVEPLTKETYVPGGSTALYDSIAEVLNTHDHEGILVIMTDGEENSSIKYTKAHVKDLIKFSKLQIIYAGVDIDDAKDLGIKTTYYYDGANTPDMMNTLSVEVASRSQTQ